MIYLILKMFFYLLLALLAGGAAGWVLRHIMAAKQDEDMQRTLADARARVPQFESLIRSRDEQINRLKDELKDKDVRINGLVDDVRKAESDARDKERALKQHVAQHETLEDLADVDSDGDAGQLLNNDGTPVDAPVEDSVMGGETLDIGPASASAIASNAAEADPALQAQVIRLEKELRAARGQAADATAEAAAAEAEVLTLKSELAKAEAEASSAAATGDAGAVDDEAKRMVAELEARLAQKTMDYERLARDLEVEKRRVTELERERELQNKSLQVLHQQLELEKERGQRVANG
ncbi:MAG: hypothetical protein AAGE43_09845 [Pseudomonadota bacterium]